MTVMSSGARRLEDLRREAAAAALGLRGGELTLIAALEAFQAENERVAETYHSMVRSLALALEARDGYTGEHSDAVEGLALAVAVRLGLDPAQVADVQSAALLHDIGKIGVPDRVLHKPGRLDEAEWALMHQHPAIAERIRARCPASTPSPPPCATRTRAGTAAAIPTVSRARRSHSPRGSCWPATPGTRSSPTGPTARRSRSPRRAPSSSAAPARQFDPRVVAALLAFARRAGGGRRAAVLAIPGARAPAPRTRSSA